MMSIRFGSAPLRVSASSAPASRRSVMKLLNRLTTIAKRRPTAVSWPSITLGINFIFLQRPAFSFQERRAYPLDNHRLRHTPQTQQLRTADRPPGWFRDPDLQPLASTLAQAARLLALSSAKRGCVEAIPSAAQPR